MKIFWTGIVIPIVGIFYFSAGLAEALPEGYVAFPPSEVVLGDNYCAEEQNNSDWCGDEVPHKVRLDAFAIARQLVTNADYRKCFAAGACEPNALHEFRPQEFNKPGQPVTFVTWNDADAYCRWANKRLPTEAEWEFAAKVEDYGGAYFGKKYEQGAPQTVASLRPNSQGLYDMLGNVYEWVRDWYAPYDLEGAQANPTGPDSGEQKVVRGGSWSSPSHFIRPSDRVAKNPEFQYSDVGFRCALSLSKKG